MPEDMVKLEKTKDADGVCCSGESEARYPWGTALNLENDLIEEMGVEGLAVGDIVEVRGFAVIENKSEHQSKDNIDRSMRIQMTAMKIRRESSDRAITLYGDDSQ